ncbi:MAG: hypothetical protein MUC85_05210 [Anaerolineales bacterium]|nr:hypothetical protein [Anaerolineales bacterium]
MPSAVDENNATCGIQGADYTSEEKLAILRRFEPAVRYTRGEQFFPMDVERYLGASSLWVAHPGKADRELVAQGSLNVDMLTLPRRDSFDAIYYLKFIDPPDLVELARYTLDRTVKTLTGKDEDSFFAGVGRLARVGYFSRLVDAFFSLSLVLRGRVPGDTAAAAAMAYKKMQSEDERYAYYGRVERQNGWVILQYWYFYAFNNWRSGFYGVNDHEGDWEMVCIYCSEDHTASEAAAQDRLVPQWAAYASHDFAGDDLRRRWDDPELEKEGDHPIIYVGAGSHASYFTSGEYLAELEIPILQPLVRIGDFLLAFWARTLRQAGLNEDFGGFNVFRIPFVDYARGDGMKIGAGGSKTWTPAVLNEATPWAGGYRGLWGLYANDPVSGENAPAGPVYNRDGSIRRSWCDPLGWAGLDKIPPPEDTAEIVQAQIAQTKEQQRRLIEEIEQKSAQLLGLGVEAEAMQGDPHLGVLHTAQTSQMEQLSTQISELRRQVNSETMRLEALLSYATRLEQGTQGPLRAHIQRAHRPSPPMERTLGPLAELVAAVSIGGMVISVWLILRFARDYLLFGLALLIGLLVLVEAGFRRRLLPMLNSITVGLAVVCALVLIYEFFWTIIEVGLLAGAVFLTWENLREINWKSLRRKQHKTSK